MTKTEFNRNFTLSLNGKFKGFDCIENKDLFIHKLNKKLHRRSPASKPLGDKLVMKVSGQVIVLYWK